MPDTSLLLVDHLLHETFLPTTRCSGKATLSSLLISLGLVFMWSVIPYTPDAGGKHQAFASMGSAHPYNLREVSFSSYFTAALSSRGHNSALQGRLIAITRAHDKDLAAKHTSLERTLQGKPSCKRVISVGAKNVCISAGLGVLEIFSGFANILGGVCFVGCAPCVAGCTCCAGTVDELANNRTLFGLLNTSRTRARNYAPSVDELVNNRTLGRSAREQPADDAIHSTINQASEESIENVMTASTSPTGTQVRCSVCFETAPAVALNPCGHVVCRGCSHEIINRPCPLCRRPVKSATMGLFLDASNEIDEENESGSQVNN